MSVATGLMVAGTAASAYGAYSAGQGSGESRSLTGELGQMPVGLYTDQLGELADMQFELEQKQALLTLQTVPLFGQALRKEQRLANRDALNFFPKYAAAEREQTGLQRAQDLEDLSRLGPGYAATLEGLSPGFARLDEEISQPRNTEILDKLHGQALYDLDLGGNLSPDELRNIEQGTRAAFADRGLEYSNPALVTEVLSRQGAETARKGERRQFAAGVQNMEEASGQNRINQLIAATQARLSPILGAMTRTGVNPTAYAGPASLAMTPQGAAGVLSTAPQVSSLAQAISPLYNYGADVFNTNFNAGEARSINKSNAITSLGGGLLSYGGSLYA